MVTVVDQGVGFDIDAVALPGSLRHEADGIERYGGYGLLLVKALADHVEFSRSEPQGTTVRAEKWLHKFDVL